jgi:hypothetical protein
MSIYFFWIFLILPSTYHLYAPLTWVGFDLIGYVPNTLYMLYSVFYSTCNINFCVIPFCSPTPHCHQECFDVNGVCCCRRAHGHRHQHDRHARDGRDREATARDRHRRHRVRLPQGHHILRPQLVVFTYRSFTIKVK